MDFAIAGKSISYSEHKKLGDLIFRAHNPRVAGSNPSPETTDYIGPRQGSAEAFVLGASRVHP